MIVAKFQVQNVKCCNECFLYEPDRDMSATIPACREVYEQETGEPYNSYLKFKKRHNQHDSIALNCPFLNKKRKKKYYVSYSKRNGYYHLCEKGFKGDNEESRCAISDEDCPRSFVNKIRDALNFIDFIESNK